MYRLSERSSKELATCDPRLRRIVIECLKYMDITVLEGARTVERQGILFSSGASKTMDSLHIPPPGSKLSLAVDIAPYPVDYTSKKSFQRFGLMAGRVLTIADYLGWPLIWGGDWDADGETKDQKFDDLVHFEVRNCESSII